jgi:hypothetical protein
MKTIMQTALYTAAAVLLGATGASAQANLAGTGFAWYPGGGACQVLGGDSSPLIYTSSKGHKYAFGSGSGCPKQVALDGPVKIYRITSMSPKPGVVILMDDGGDRWSILKISSNNYQRKKVK